MVSSEGFFCFFFLFFVVVVVVFCFWSKGLVSVSFCEDTCNNMKKKQYFHKNVTWNCITNLITMYADLDALFIPIDLH